MGACFRAHRVLLSEETHVLRPVPQPRVVTLMLRVNFQLDNATMGTFWGAASRRAEAKMEHSLNSVVPTLAAWEGLGNRPRMPYRFPGFDLLHVRSLSLLLTSKKWRLQSGCNHSTAYVDQWKG